MASPHAMPASSRSIRSRTRPSRRPRRRCRSGIRRDQL